MGLPTTANYIVVASLMSHVVQELGAQNGLFVPLIAIHMFVFYFGIMADVTPPVGLASFAAAAISGADPIRTGIQAFAYSLRTAVLPFFFIFNTELIMEGVDTIWHGAWVFFYATVAILIFSAGVQGYFITRNRFYETIMLLLVAVTFFVPQMWIDILYPSYKESDPAQIISTIESLNPGEQIRISGRGEDINGEVKTFTTYLPIDGSNGLDTLRNFGITPVSEGKYGPVYEVDFDTQAFKTGVEFDLAITGLYVPAAQPDRRWMYIPAVLLLMYVVVLQTVRRRRERALVGLGKNGEAQHV